MRIKFLYTSPVHIYRLYCNDNVTVSHRRYLSETRSSMGLQNVKGKTFDAIFSPNHFDLAAKQQNTDAHMHDHCSDFLFRNWKTKVEHKHIHINYIFTHQLYHQLLCHVYSFLSTISHFLGDIQLLHNVRWRFLSNTF